MSTQSPPNKFLAGLIETATRFPLAVFIAALSTADALGLHQGPRISRMPLVHLWTGSSQILIYAFLWVVAVDFFAERRGTSWGTRVALWAVGCATLFLIVPFASQVWLAPGILLAVLLLLVGLSGYLFRGCGTDFWNFNHQLWLGLVFAQVSAGLLVLGIYAISFSLRVLFGIEMPRPLVSSAVIVALGFVANFAFLAFAPRELDNRDDPTAQAHFTSRAVTAIAKYILVPLLLVYTAILYAYLVKIGFQGHLPKGEVAWMVVGYLVSGIVTLLLIFPVRETGGVLVRLTWRFWLGIAVVPVVLLFLAVSERIEAYGITERRYLLIVAGVWILILAAAKLVMRNRFDVRLIPGVLMVLLLIASIGPFGAYAISAKSQVAQLQALLEREGKLVDGVLVENPAIQKERGRAAILLSEIRERDALYLLKPWFADHEANPFADKNSERQTIAAVMKALNATLHATSRGTTTSTNYSFRTSGPLVLDSTPYARIVGPLRFYGRGAPTIRVDLERYDILSTGLVTAKGTFELAIGQGEIKAFDLQRAFRTLPHTTNRQSLDAPVLIKPSDGTERFVLWVDSAAWTVHDKDPTLHITTIGAWLGIAEEP